MADTVGDASPNQISKYNDYAPARYTRNAPGPAGLRAKPARLVNRSTATTGMHRIGIDETHPMRPSFRGLLAAK